MFIKLFINYINSWVINYSSVTRVFIALRMAAGPLLIDRPRQVFYEEKSASWS
jgi:hypothetical protein